MEVDVFKLQDVLKLLQGKRVVFLGDSNVRALYKDLLILSQENTLISDTQLKSKMENTFAGDILKYHGKKYNGRDYRENREFCNKDILPFTASYYYLTRIYDQYVENIFKDEIRRLDPHVLFVNSCLWDITRWGPNGVVEYKKNLKLFTKLLEKSVGRQCLVVWLTAPPISQSVRGGFLIPQLQFLQFSLRYHVGEANNYAAKIFKKAGYDVIDVHYYLTKFLRWRTKDGIHWYPPVVRLITNRLLTHISLAWDIELPHRTRLKLNTSIPIDARISSENQCSENFLQETICEPEPMDLETPRTSPVLDDQETPTLDEIAENVEVSFPTDNLTRLPDSLRTQKRNYNCEGSASNTKKARVLCDDVIDKATDSQNSKVPLPQSSQTQTISGDSDNVKHFSLPSNKEVDNSSVFKFDSKGKPLIDLSLKNTSNKKKKQRCSKFKRNTAHLKQNCYSVTQENQNRTAYQTFLNPNLFHQQTYCAEDTSYLPQTQNLMWQPNMLGSSHFQQDFTQDNYFNSQLYQHTNTYW